MEAEDPLEAISGTNGVTGAADAVLVLARGSKGTTLYGRGRDIEEIETAMRFDGGRWSVLGDDLTGMKAVNVRVLLGKMVASGDICQPRIGFYTVQFSKPQE
jgi:regulator of RNase E activity RraA